MDELMEMLSDYVTLVDLMARSRPLSVGERARWLALTHVIPGTGEPPGRSDEDGSEDGAPVQVTGVGGFELARLLAVSRDGMRLHLRNPLPAGTRTVVRVLTPRTGFEYTFPCLVAWSDEDKMGLAFDGAPTRVPLATAMSVGWQRPLDLRTGWGAKQTTGSA